MVLPFSGWSGEPDVPKQVFGALLQERGRRGLLFAETSFRHNADPSHYRPSAGEVPGPRLTWLDA